MLFVDTIKQILHPLYWLIYGSTLDGGYVLHALAHDANAKTLCLH